MVRTSELRERGWSEYRIARAVRDHRLTRLRRGWVAGPGADPELVRAARLGVVIGCISQARRLGLWVAEHPERHYAMARTNRPPPPCDDVIHWRRPLVPRDPDALEDRIENVLDAVAHCLPYEDAVSVWDAACKRRIADLAELSRLPFTGPARRVLAAVDPFADSGLETLVRQRLDWLGIRIAPQAWVQGQRVDFLLGDRLVLQIDGGSHVGVQRVSDTRHDAELRQLGYTVLRVGYGRVMDDWPETQLLITRMVAQGLHLQRGPA